MSRKVLRIGVVGFSRNQFDKRDARQILRKLFEGLQKKHTGKEIQIVSGYTNAGVPKIAYELADEMGFTTVGFSAKQALKVRSGLYPVKQCTLIGEKFGDESEAFVQSIDGLIRVGGGLQSRREVALFKALHQAEVLDRLLKEYEVEWYGKN